MARLHAVLLRVARAELARRGGQLRVCGPELDDLAHQAAADAVVAIIAKVGLVPLLREDPRAFPLAPHPAEQDPAGPTLTGTFADQAQLHGLLDQLRDLGIHLISVNPIDQGSVPHG